MNEAIIMPRSLSPTDRDVNDPPDAAEAFIAGSARPTRAGPTDVTCSAGLAGLGDAQTVQRQEAHQGVAVPAVGLGDGEDVGEFVTVKPRLCGRV